MLLVPPCPQTKPAPAPSQRVAALLRELRPADAAAFPGRLEAVLRGEEALVAGVLRALADPATRSAALLELAADDEALAAAVGDALPPGPADEATTRRALAPWIEAYVEQPIDQRIERELAAFEERCAKAELALLRVVPGDPPVLRAEKDALAARREESRASAWAAIHDLALYPDEDHGDAGQAEVDRRVELARRDHATLAARLDEDLVQLYRKKPEAWGSLVDGLAADRAALGASLPMLAARAGPGKRARAADESPRARLARGLVLTLLGRGSEASALLADASAYGLALVQRVRARRVLEFNAERLAKGPEDEAERWINEHRIVLGCLPLEHDERLRASARAHSREMEELGYFGHDSPAAERRTVVERARLAGYPDPAVVECILAGAKDGDGASAARAWIDSSAHHRMLVRTDMRQIGIGRASALFTANLGAAHELAD